jgi:hypothetical protein
LYSKDEYSEPLRIGIKESRKSIRFDSEVINSTKIQKANILVNSNMLKLSDENFVNPYFEGVGQKELKYLTTESMNWVEKPGSTIILSLNVDLSDQ